MNHSRDFYFSSLFRFQFVIASSVRHAKVFLSFYFAVFFISLFAPPAVEIIRDSPGYAIINYRRFRLDLRRNFLPRKIYEQNFNISLISRLSQSDCLILSLNGPEANRSSACL